MKMRILAVCTLVSMSAVLMACGSSSKANESTEVKVVEASEASEVSAATEAAGSESVAVDAGSTEATAESTEAVTGDSSEGTDEEGKYVVFTDASNAEVEAYAEKIKTAVLAKDWDTIGDMIEYPIGSKETNNLCSNKEEFLAYANNTGFDEEYFKTLSEWNISDLWGNYEGACIDNGNIWFRDVDTEKKEFKIVSFLGMPEGTVNLSSIFSSSFNES